jgi:hypothetical protein
MYLPPPGNFGEPVATELVYSIRLQIARKLNVGLTFKSFHNEDYVQKNDVQYPIEGTRSAQICRASTAPSEPQPNAVLVPTDLNHFVGV